MSAMATTRDNDADFAALAAELAGGTSLVSLPSPMSLDLTTWLYDQPTGLLTNKLYADGRGPTYTYTPDGKLATRTWARGVVTTYAYAPSGSLINILYSDSTPAFAFQYDRLGRQKTITDVLGTRTNSYDTITLALTSERLPDGTVLSRTQDTLGRDTGFSLGQDYAVQYSYDTYGRFHSVTSSIESTSSTYTYTYLPSSDLLSGITASSGFSWTRAYEPNRDLIVTVDNRFGTNLVSRFDYHNDALARRTKRIDNSAVTNNFGYNIRSQVTSAAMGTNTYGYAFDPIGNRREASRLEAAQAVTNTSWFDDTSTNPSPGSNLPLDEYFRDQNGTLYPWAQDRSAAAVGATWDALFGFFSHDHACECGCQ
jgi:YD repeat-containing protein